MSKYQRFFIYNTCAQTYNEWVYRFQQLPLIGKHIPHSLYHFNSDKTLMIALAAFFLAIFSLLKKLIYFGCLLALSFWLSKLMKTDQEEFKTIAQQVLITLSLLTGTISRSRLVDHSPDNIMAVKIFRLPFKTYLLTKHLNLESLHRLTYLLVLAGLSGFFGLSLWQILAFTLLITGLNTFFIYLCLFLYRLPFDKCQEKVNLGQIVLSIFLLIIGSVWVLTRTLPATNWAFSPWAGLIGLLSGAFAIYRLTQVPDLDQLGLKSLQIDQLKTMDNFNAEEVQVKLKDDDLSHYQAETLANRKSQGVVWLNHLFYHRVNHYLNKNLRLKTYGLLIFFVLIHIILFLAKPHLKLQEMWRALIFFSLAGGYVLFSSEHFTKFCFYQLDRKMLKYPFYRQPQHLITSLLTRFKQIIKLHAPLLVITVIGLLSTYLLVGGRKWSEMLLIVVIEVICMGFFSFHYLILYYLIQPFTESMKSKSLVYTITNYLIYCICIYGADDIAKLSGHFVVFMLIFMLVYLIAGLIAVYHLSPRTFRLK